ncbi:HET-domain-containing protein [Clathrospora elynae]|uniref:HET-domain-containing protein n=1 Tax=Clathrospora elynae TaxID=706981 RepID=A0A6A5SEM4_9PLEO|nr:HET-domain-containing protein [Clathrospora elynae]
MHLLKYGEDGELTIAKFNEDTIPSYAILSHRWGAEAQEVTFDDIARTIGKDKSGYEKIQFCGEQARQDGLQYFWIDTCCINKANKAEFSWAIQSMFRWYRNAARCYVYLSDVTASPQGTDEEASAPLWDSDFRKSEWFTRGWTLQELLAPGSVEFFTREWEKLGDKLSLIQQIYEITGIPRPALQGVSLSQFSINERLRWKEHRKTTCEEDGTYSLLGIFDVDLAPVYGEGAAGAFRRLMVEIEKRERCIKDIRRTCTDPRDDKKRIENTKGGLLKDSYRWILDNASFQQWHYDPQSRLLWIKGDPGKGKTMLLCGIIDELRRSIAKMDLVSYFFCQATDSRINSATAVLRGLLYLLVIQQPSLIFYVREKYDHAGKDLFEDANAWFALTEILAKMLRDPRLNATYLIIDALDECVTDLPKLLEFVAKQSSASSRVKWIVSSRNWPGIEEQLEQAGHKVRLSLELNADSVSAAVNIFIQQKVSKLAEQKKYDAPTHNAVLARLTSNANDTFLWVALVCQDLQATARRNVLKKLDLFPPGLDALYKRMMQQISESDDAELCKQMLALIALVYRPITLEELVALVKQLEDIADDTDSIREIIGLCGSFLTLRDGIVYLVHQSAKDFLLAKAAGEVLPSGTEVIHHAILVRSLQVMSKTLKRDMYGLQAFGHTAKKFKLPDPDPLASSRYSCVYWVDHLCSSDHIESLQDGGAIEVFLRNNYLYWLEALSLCKSIPKGLLSMAKLQSIVQGMGKATSFKALVQDAHRFVMYHKGAIENSPLQAYVSALLFSPTASLVRKLFQREEPEWITIQPAMSNNWSACLQTLEGHSESVSSIWDASSGTCLQTLEIMSSNVAFDSTGSHLHTDIGLVAIIASQRSDVTVNKTQQSIHLGICISSDGTWITHNAQKLLWLPSEYRPICSAASGRFIGIATGSGKIFTCCFK